MDSWFIVSCANPLRADALFGSPCLSLHTQGLRPGLWLRSAETAELRYLRFAQEQRRRRTSLPSLRSGTEASSYFATFASLRNRYFAVFRYLRFAQKQRRRRASLPSPRSGTDASPSFATFASLRNRGVAVLRFLRFAQKQRRRRASLPSPRSGTEASPYFATLASLRSRGVAVLRYLCFAQEQMPRRTSSLVDAEFTVPMLSPTEGANLGHPIQRSMTSYGFITILPKVPGERIASWARCASANGITSSMTGLKAPDSRPLPIAS
jgi:hypothetical protein